MNIKFGLNSFFLYKVPAALELKYYYKTKTNVRNLCESEKILADRLGAHRLQR